MVGRLYTHGSDNMLEKGWERVPALKTLDRIREEQHLASLRQRAGAKAAAGRRRAFASCGDVNKHSKD